MWTGSTIPTKIHLLVEWHRPDTCWFMDTTEWQTSMSAQWTSYLQIRALVGGVTCLEFNCCVVAEWSVRLGLTAQW